MFGVKSRNKIRELKKKIESLEKENSRLKRDATTDHLTKVCNRREGDKMLRKELSRSFRSKKPVSSVLIDIDHFKKYNDTHGHPQGDVLLQDLCKNFEKLLREEDIISRYGGEEFEIILPGTNLIGAYSAMNKIRKYLKEKLGITVSAGIASSQNSGVDLLYGNSGRELLNDYIESGGDLKAVEDGIKDYSEKSGISQTKVKIMLDNFYHFFKSGHESGKKINSNSQYRKMGLQLMRKLADDALYRAKNDGRDRIYAQTRPQQMILNPMQKSYYASPNLS